MSGSLGLGGTFGTWHDASDSEEVIADEVMRMRRRRKLPEGPGVSDEQVVEVLRPWASRLAGAAARQEPVAFVPETWCRWLAKVPGPDLQGVTETTERLLGWLDLDRPLIDRSHLGSLASRRTSPEANLRLLVATLVWGRGKQNARMLPRMVDTLKTSTRDQVLAETAAAAANRQLAAAYQAWTLPGLREAFLTKWLWAAGTRAKGPGIVALVLDGRVWRSLNDGLGWYSLEAAQSWDRADRYAAYCGAAARWAQRLSEHASSPVTAEDVEFGLFHAAGQLQALDMLLP